MVWGKRKSDIQEKPELAGPADAPGPGTKLDRTTRRHKAKSEPTARDSKAKSEPTARDSKAKSEPRTKRGKKEKSTEIIPFRPGARGWLGRGRGQDVSLHAAEEYRGTTVQVCGLWPWSAGSGSPMVGVPFGRHLVTGATVCCDPISWFQRARLLSNPSVFFLGRPGLGKSTAVRRMVTGLAGYGVMPLVLGDVKPDYVDLVRALGGQVIRLGTGSGYLNVLDPGEARAAADRLTGTLRTEVLNDAHSRRLTTVSALITIMRGGLPPNDREETILDRALRILNDRHETVPTLPDLLEVIRSAPEDLRLVALDRNDMTKYLNITENLEATLIGLVSGGRLGDTFSKATSEPMVRNQPVVFDVSGIDDSNTDMQAAALIACWSAGFGSVNVATALADAGLEPRRHYFVVMDELWRALRSGAGMVERVDSLTRLNRTRGVGLAMITHTMKDLMSLATEQDRMKAVGFVERSGMVITGGLPGAEMPALTTAIPLSQAEQNMLMSWQDPPVWNSRTGREEAPPGRGKFLIKVGGRPGIPVQVQLTQSEMAINDTNQRWHQRSRVVTQEA